jgi:hypothetical protein
VVLLIIGAIGLLLAGYLLAVPPAADPGCFDDAFTSCGPDWESRFVPLLITGLVGVGGIWIGGVVLAGAVTALRSADDSE